MMSEVPPLGDTPVTTPDPEPTVATEGVPLVQLPPPPSASVVVAPAQTVAVPDIATGTGFTVTMAVTEQPLVDV